MKVVDGRKSTARTYIRNDLKSNVTNLSRVRDDIHDTMSLLDAILGGTRTGSDRTLIGYCQKALDDVSLALQQIGALEASVDQLDITKEVPDDEYH